MANVVELYYKIDGEYKRFPIELIETDPIFTAWDKSTGILITESQIEDLKEYITDITGESIDDLSDVDLTDISDGDILKWDADESKFIPSEEATQVQSDWDQEDDTDPSFLKNKPPVITQSDLTTALGNYVPYINATGGVNLGDEGLQCGDLETNGNVQFRNLEPATQETGPRLICSDAEGNLTWRPKGDTDISIQNIPEINLDDLGDGSILQWNPNLEQFVCIDNTPPLPITYKIRKVLTPVHGHIGVTDEGLLVSSLSATESINEKTYFTYTEIPITTQTYTSISINLLWWTGKSQSANHKILGTLKLFIQNTDDLNTLIAEDIPVEYTLPEAISAKTLVKVPIPHTISASFASKKTIGAMFEFTAPLEEATINIQEISIANLEIVIQANTQDGLFGLKETS